MKKMLKNQWFIVVGLLLLLPSPGLAAAKKARKPAAQSQIRQPATAVPAAGSKEEKPAERKESLQDKDASRSKKMPVYRPPLRGAPAGRVAGGTRGIGGKIPCLCTLVPEHVGLTVSRQPCMYYFLSRAAALPLEFTLIEKEAVYPLVTVRLPAPQTPGIHAVCLADYGKRLKQDVQYKWFVALIPDEEHRAKDILAAGAIELVSLPTDLGEKVRRADSVEAEHIYAESGIWYDALAAISAAIAQEPGNHELVEQRVSLLFQVGLTTAASYDRQAGGGN